MKVLSGLKYAESHEWVKVDGDVAVVGLSDFAQSEMGDVVFVELPEAGDNVSKGESCGNVEAVKTVSDVYAPVSGEVSEVNEALEDEPTLVNTDPYEKGWILKIKMSAPSELDDLMDSDKYKETVE